MPKTRRFPPTLRRIEIVAFPDVQVLDVTGPLQVFESANAWADENGLARTYETCVVSRNSPVRAWAGLEFTALPLPRSSKPVDTLVVTGGRGVRQAVDDARLVEWISRRASAARRVVSVCTGAFLLAKCGLLANKRAATHWAECDRLAGAYPDVQVDPDPIFIEDGNVWTSAGVTAGIDLSLALVERDLGPAAAIAIARDLVVFLKRPGGQAQFSAALQLQSSDARFNRLHDWMADHLNHDLRVPVLAERVGMSERSFVRHYAKLVGQTPARAIERMRIERARDLLSTTSLPIKRIAQRCGFGTEETMRRSFLRLVSVTPQSYRDRFRRLGN